MAITLIPSPGNRDEAVDINVLSAQIPAGKDAFSWLVPVIVSPFCNIAAAPTLKCE
jgi:hypothetical protein